MDESTIKQLMEETKCRGCGKHYTADNVDVLGQFEGLWFMSVFCPECRAQYLVAAQVSEEAEAGIVTDLSPEELERLGTAGGVGADDMLDMRLFLRDFQGDMKDLFGAGDC